MPLLVDKYVDGNNRLALWHITEGFEDLVALQNCPIDPILLDVNELLKKQRLCARILINLLGPETCNEIAYDVFNKPFLLHSTFKISISHSQDLVAVIISATKETGIDIERIKPTIERISSKFMSERELAVVETPNRMEHLTIYWCAKEALYKYYGKKGLIFRDNLFVEPFTPENYGRIKGHISIGDFTITLSLCYEKIGEYMLVYVSDIL